MRTCPTEPLYSMDLLARRLSALVDLCPAERELLLRQAHNARTYAAGSEVILSHERPSQPALIISGWACREQITPGGHRQVLSILIPGDLVGGVGSERRPLDLVEVVALSKVKLINVAATLQLVAQDPARFPAIARGLAMLRFAEEQRLLDQLVRLGSEPGHQRIAGFLLELFQRCRSIDFVTGGYFAMPLTQEILSSSVGLSLVHVNRVLRQLKADGIIRFQRGMAEILDMARLARTAGAPPRELVPAAAVSTQRTVSAAQEMCLA